MQNHFLQLIIPPISYIKPCFYLIGQKACFFQPSEKFQLVMARGLISHWKIPVYFASDTAMTMDLLWSIVKHLEESGFRVRGVSFDLGNKKFQSEFGLNSEVYKVRNPFVPDRWFYLIPDAPHGLKRFRDHCLDKTYLIPKDPYSRPYGQPGQISLREMVKRGGLHYCMSRK